MKKVHRSAQGKFIDMEKLRYANEEVISVGNMKVNARGDRLGPGGRVVKTRNELMDEHYNVNSELAVKNPVNSLNHAEILAQAAEQTEIKNSVRGALAKKILDDQNGEQ